jgi:thiol:disulfide interchange protein DsbC
LRDIPEENAMTQTCAPKVFGLATMLAVVAALFAAAAFAQTSAGVAPLTAEAATVKRLLEEKFKGAKVGSISKSPYFGLYEVLFDESLVYTDAKVTYVLVGNIYDATTKKNLTDAKLRSLSRVAFDSLPLNLAFKKVKGNGQRKLAVFSDPDCPYCAKLEHELKGIDNVTIYTFLYPIDQLHPDAARKARIIWCAPDKVKAWDAFFESGALPTNNGDCDNPVAATNVLGLKMKVNATPTLVFADGSIVPGALPAEQLEAEIKQGEVEAARLAAAKK